MKFVINKNGKLTFDWKGAYDDGYFYSATWNPIYLKLPSQYKVNDGYGF